MKQEVIFPLITKEAELLPFLITGVALNYDEQGVERLEGYSDYQWAYCIEGEGVFDYQGQKYTIKKGTAFFFKKDIPHRYFVVEGPWRIHWITFKGKSVVDVLNYLNLEEVEVIELFQDQCIQHLMENIAYILKGNMQEYQKLLISSHKLYQLLIEQGTNKTSTHQKQHQKRHEKLQPVITYMQQNYMHTVTLEQLAEQIGISIYYLCRMFKQTYHMKPIEYLNRLRIQKAKVYLMQRNDLRIKDITQLVGFEDKSYFAMQFRKYEACSPTEFRSRHGNLTLE